MKEIVALVLLLIYTICEFTAYIPQIIKLIKTKSSDDLSIMTWLIWVFSAVCYLFYVLLECSDIGVTFIASMNLIFIIIVCILTVHYQNKKPKKHSKLKK